MVLIIASPQIIQWLWDLISSFIQTGDDALFSLFLPELSSGRMIMSVMMLKFWFRDMMMIILRDHDLMRGSNNKACEKQRGRMKKLEGRERNWIRMESLFFVMWFFADGDDVGEYDDEGETEILVFLAIEHWTVARSQWWGEFFVRGQKSLWLDSSKDQSVDGREKRENWVTFIQKRSWGWGKLKMRLIWRGDSTWSSFPHLNKVCSGGLCTHTANSPWGNRI